jgi:O-antigen/teichoic acid export membrane protein
LIRKERLWDLAIVVILLALPMLLFWPVTIGGRTLVPFDNLYAFQPWQTFSTRMGVGVPHNELLNDLLLENYAWKTFIVQALQKGQIPLWNPYLFAGVPFLAAGQHSALYPFSVLFYLLPVTQAYGYFTVLHLFLAALFMHVFVRTLGVGRLGSTIAAITYAFCGFMIVSVDFPMVVAAATWLPLILTMTELAIRSQEVEDAPRVPIPYMLGGALALGIQFLAGHAEMSYYVVMVTGFYAACRLGILYWRKRAAKRSIILVVVLASMVALGVGLGAVQLVPFLELARLNFRQGSATYQEIIGWAYPLRQVITFVIPDFFGNPSHHAYFDVLTRQWTAISENAHGQPINTIFWGIKNYVEAGSYVGILPLLLGAVALLRRRDRYVWIFASLAIVSFALSFGVPLYALLYYLLPGYSQLHTPFRWVFPYSLSMAVLAGLGAESLRVSFNGVRNSRLQIMGPRLLGWLAIAGGVAGLVCALLILVAPAMFILVADRLLASSDLAQASFPDGQAFLSYQWRNLLLFSLFLAAAGAVLRISYCDIYLPSRLGSHRVWKVLAVVVLTLDLLFMARGFNPATDPRLAEFIPPSVEFLQSDHELFRLTSFNAPEEKTLHANVGMYYGLYDVRGYDSIIPKQYADFMGLIEEQGELIYNRIAPLYGYDALDSPLLDLLNVKYVVTTQHIPNPNYTLVYEDEVRIYRNDDYLARAFVVYDAEVIEDDESLLRKLPSLDPRERVLLSERPPEGYLAETSGTARESTTEARVLDYDINDVLVEAELSHAGWLILGDSYFPGWKAFLQLEDGQERELDIYRADYNFRAVHLEQGHNVVRFRYSPMSLKLGVYASFLAAVILLACVGFWLWGRLYREEEGDPLIKRVVKNSMTPMATSFLNKLIDTAFAMLMLRILGPEGAGKYGFAVVVYAFLEIVTNFGLNTLLTREVSKDHNLANRYLSNTAILRLIILVVISPLLFVFLVAWRRFFALPDDTTVTILLLSLSLIPGSISAALTSVFLAYEKMEYPAAITTVTTIIRVSLGVVVLLLGMGIIGLAAVSIATSIITALILLYLLVRLILRPRLEFEPGFNREMIGTSYPLMLNHLLATLFWRVDVTLLQPMKGDTVVGWYTTAYRFLDALNIIPSTFTVAIFPVMSRYATEAKDALMRTYAISLKILIIVSLPIAVLTTFYAEGIILVVGGQAYLPHAAIALRLLIWSVPFGFINSVTQYVLIAIDKQRFLTGAFVVGAGFNLVANLLLIPTFSYQAAALTTIMSEIVLLLPFYYGVRKHLTAVPWVSLTWRPVLSSLLTGALLWLLQNVTFLVLIPLSLAVYVGSLVVTGTFTPEDIALLKRLLPGRFRRGVEAPDARP